MASSSAGVVVRVGNSMNGVVYAVRLASAELVVEELREALVPLSDIPLSDQILLGGPPFARLDPRRALESYGLPSPDKQVFLYDRRMLSQENPLPPRLALEPVEIEMPSLPVPASEGSRLLSESSSPLLRALGEYEAHFQHQVNQSEALERGSVANVDACERCVTELEVQSQAITAAIANLESFCSSMRKRFTPFWTEYEQASVRHDHLLRHFESFLNALGDITLHPALVTPERKTLLDCIPADREREWALQCQQSQSHLRQQLTRLRDVHDSIVAEVTALLQSQDHIAGAFADVADDLALARQHVASHHGITAKLSENLDVVMRKVAETSSEVQPATPMMLLASTNMLEVCREIDELYHQHLELLPSAQRLAEEIKGTMSKLSSTKASFFSLVHANLRRISMSQSKIRDFENSLAMLKDALQAQKKQFAELEHLEKLPDSYASCLVEITRRLKYGRRFSDRIQAMAEELALMRDEEVSLREDFLRRFGQHLPRDFVPGLAEKPSHCEFRMRPFDQSLPLIEIEDDDGLDEPTLQSDGQVDDRLDEETKEEASPPEQSRAEDTLQPEVDALRKRCEELEAQVAELTIELQQTAAKKTSSYFSESCGSMARSDVSKNSIRDDDSSTEFPLVLALAATGAGMTSSSEAGDRSHLLERELQSMKAGRGGLEQLMREKDLVIAKLESENQQYLLNAAAFEEYPFPSSFPFPAIPRIQERDHRERVLQDNQVRLQQSVQSLQLSLETQRASLVRVLKLLNMISPSSSLEEELENPEAFLQANFGRIETRLRELMSSSDTETVLREELERRHEEINLLESQHFDLSDSFKISFRSFNVNDLALFLPTSFPSTDAQRVYLAFHHGCPHRFLAEESISSFLVAGQKFPDYVVGRIVFIDEQLATEDNNPYGLNLGTTFYMLTTPATMSARETAQQFDREFQRYTTKHAGKGAQAVAMARAELSKYLALVQQDKRLEDAKISKGRLTPEQRAAYEKKIVEIEKALDNYHNSIAGVNRTKAILSFALLSAFILLAFFQPWKKYM
ncbi:hypothetical protein P43SY_000211 [Pythium insidiosum]|uniref:Autophagy-related protein 11 C-terminal domain-containing protein n=1 Tax=Pythium insidiosum TaxID=114742 RepID=A0AAD5MAH9_PYTIN|nr:hypothetical protein P43SY_000211 [Pythium insidiosum]